jgi:dipeptidyl aminopeptidase/acylaminoacyl peptidase
MSPNGQYLAAETYYDAQEHIEIVDINKKKSYVIFNGTNGVNITISDIKWVDDNSLIVQLNKVKSNAGDSIFKVMHLDFKKNITVDSTFEFEKRGFIVDALPQSKNKVYFAHLIHTKKYTSGVYLVDLKDYETSQKDFRFARKIGKNIRSPIYWLADKNKIIRMILSNQKDSVHYWVLKKNRWIKVFSLAENSDDLIYPRTINSSNQFIAIKRLKNKDKKGVYLFNSENLLVEKELFYSKNFDVSDIKINPSNSQLLAVSYIKNGITHDVLMSKGLQKAQQSLNEKYQKYENYYIASNLDYSNHLFLLHNFQNEGIYVNVDLNKLKISKIIDKAKWRRNLDKGHLEVIEYENSDGLTIESYLSLPESQTAKALIVMPHGGPIGVRSYGYFDSLSHLFASYGIAVLKINYRGSSGFGKKFQESGKKQWGNKIEKDINDVVSYVIEKFKLDDNKICSAGSSYGGYSALMLHINYPQRYKCISSMAGPTDLPLMFTSSDWNVNKESIKQMLEIVGDPHHDIEKLKTQSPLYNVKKIEAPVLLIHGTDDPRVSIEHSIRLEYVLNKLNKPVEFIKIEGAKHGFSLLEHQVLYATALLKFINKSLNLEINLPDEKEITEK